MVDGYDVSDPAIAFYDVLLAIADDLVDLEVDIAEHHVDLTGIRSYSVLQEFER